MNVTTNYLPRIVGGALLAAAAAALTGCSSTPATHTDAPASTSSTTVAAVKPAAPVKDTGGPVWRDPATLAVWKDLSDLDGRMATDSAALDTTTLTADCAEALTVVETLQTVTDAPATVQRFQQAALRDMNTALHDCVAGNYDASTAGLTVANGELNQATAAIKELTK